MIQRGAGSSLGWGYFTRESYNVPDLPSSPSISGSAPGISACATLISFFRPARLGIPVAEPSGGEMGLCEMAHPPHSKLKREV